METRVENRPSVQASLDRRPMTMDIGSVGLEHKSRTTGDSWEEVATLHVDFNVKFKRQPKIFLSPRTLEVHSRSAGTFYQVEATDIDVKGFNLRINGAYAKSFSNAAIDWLAVEGGN